MYDILKVTDNAYDEYYSEKCLIDFVIPKTGHAVPVLIWFHGGDLETGGRQEAFVSRFASEYGIAVASADYRTYPEAHYPDFVNDAARACEYVWNYGQSTGLFNRYFIGGSEAGAYIAMMLYFNPVFMREFVMSPDFFKGFLFDGGSPLTPPGVLKERCIDERATRIDKASPLYWLDQPPSPPESRPPVLICTAERELPGIDAANDLLRDAMLAMGYHPDRVTRTVVSGVDRSMSRQQPKEDDCYPMNAVFGDFIEKIGGKIVNNNETISTASDFML